MPTQPIPTNGDNFETCGRLSSVDRLAWRSFCEELKQRIQAELVEDDSGWLAGNLGEAIANAAGMASLEFVSPEQLAEGVCDWLDSQDFGPQETREEACLSTPDPGSPAPNGAGEGLRGAGPAIARALKDLEPPSYAERDFGTGTSSLAAYRAGFFDARTDALLAVGAIATQSQEAI